VLQLVSTADSSHTLFNEELNETYHSKHGAIAESLHVFIKAGLQFVLDKNITNEIHILEIGFGTGLNALLTFKETEKSKRKIIYDSLEAFPLSKDISEKLNYGELLEQQLIFNKLHFCNWDSPEVISDNFVLNKISTSVQCFVQYKQYNLIYFDAFAPSKQPEMWTQEIFDKMFSILKPSGTLVTYCAKGEVKRNLKASGFTIESLPGPKGKREMTRATKP